MCAKNCNSASVRSYSDGIEVNRRKLLIVTASTEGVDAAHHPQSFPADLENFWHQKPFFEVSPTRLPDPLLKKSWAQHYGRLLISHKLNLMSLFVCLSTSCLRQQ